jgi:hypothetical protein
LKEQRLPVKALPLCGHLPRPFVEESKELRAHSYYYKFARGGLRLSSDDKQFADRFRFLFSECVSSEEELRGLPVFILELTTNHLDSVSLISYSAEENLDYCAFILELFPERLLRELPYNDFAEWRCLFESDGIEPVIAVGNGQLLIDKSYSWQAIVAQFAVSNVMRLQQDVRFFHAATVAVGNNGVFIVGAKGSGKTTLSLALAARSHAFLGDEYGAVCVRTGALLPFRRAVSIRPGSRAARVESRLQEIKPLIDKTEDGLHRVRLSIRDVFPDSAPRSVVLSHCFFLRGFEREASVVEYVPGEKTIPSLQPLLASLWSQRPGRLMMEFLRIFSRVRCFHVDVGGTPDETAELIERVVEGR